MAAILTAAGVVLAGGSACDGVTGVFGGADAPPELLVDGEVGDQTWAAVRVDHPDRGDCVELRHRGVTKEFSCQPATFLDQYTLTVVVIRGTAQPLVFGVLPEGTVRAEVALDGSAPLRRRAGRAMAPVEVRAFGKTGLYVMEPAPDGRTASDLSWRDGSSVTLEAYDARDRKLTPK